MCTAYRRTFAVWGARLIAAAIFALAVTASADAVTASENGEIDCLALTIYHEARGEPVSGRLAVGYVVINRARSGLFPAKLCDVVRQGGERLHQCQFSWWCDGRSDAPRDDQAFRDSLRLAEEIYRGCVADPTRGALWYHSTAVRPAWSQTVGRKITIGRHVFYRGTPAATAAPVQPAAMPSSNCATGPTLTAAAS